MGWAGQYASALIALGRFEDADRALADLTAVAERLGRTWMGIEADPEYAKSSRVRFPDSRVSR